MSISRTTSAHLLAGLLGAAGALHILVPRPFEAITPRFLGEPRPWVLASGAAELAAAAAMAVPASRRAGGLAAAGLLVAMFPANVQMALDAKPGRRGLARNPIVAWGRLPLQAPLVWWALDVARAPTSRR